MRRPLAVIAAALITLVLPDLRRPIEPGFAVGNYRVILDLTHRPDVRGECILLVNPLDRSRQLSLDSTGLVIDSVMIEGQAARFETQSRKLKVDLPHPSEEARPFKLDIRYHGKPAEGLLARLNRFGQLTWFADNWPTRLHRWLPSIDEPSEKATVDLTVTGPVDLDVVANGRLLSTAVHESARVTHWREDVPIPVYCIVLGAAPFSFREEKSGSGVDLYYYAYSRDDVAAGKLWNRAPEMVNFFTSLIGPYAYEKLALVESLIRFRGMENASAVFLNQDLFDGTSRNESTVAHEIAHQWFGDSLTIRDWHDLWLNEGFATYFSALFFEHADGEEAFRRILEEQRRLILSGPSSGALFDPHVTEPMSLLDSNSYLKGSWVLHMLRHIMGDRRFFEGIRDYYSSFRDGTVGTSDFQRVMERHYGARLDWFFGEWIFGSGLPSYRCSWRWSEPAKLAHLELEQTQRNLFRMPVDLLIRTSTTSMRTTVVVSRRMTETTISLPSKPLSITIDPDGAILAAAPGD